MSETLEKSSCKEALTNDEWYQYICAEVDYRCDMCDAVLTDIGQKEEKVKRAYAITATSLKEVYEIPEIAKRWWGLVFFTGQVLYDAYILQQTNQICGADLSTLQEYYEEALDRLQLYCPEVAKAARGETQTVG
jgi:hypothetical protein